MNENENQDYMTITHFSNMTGLTKQTIINYIKELYPDLIEHGKETKLNEDESSEVMKELRIKKMPNLERDADINFDSNSNENTNELNKYKKLYFDTNNELKRILNILSDLTKNHLKEKNINLNDSFFNFKTTHYKNKK